MRIREGGKADPDKPTLHALDAVSSPAKDATPGLPEKLDTMQLNGAEPAVAYSLVVQMPHVIPTQASTLLGFSFLVNGIGSFWVCGLFIISAYECHAYFSRSRNGGYCVCYCSV